MNPLGFFIPAGLVLTLIVALMQKGNASESKPQGQLPPNPDIPPMPPVGPTPPDYTDHTQFPPGVPTDYDDAPPNDNPPGVPDSMLPPGDRPPIVNPGTAAYPGGPETNPPYMDTPSGPILLRAPLNGLSNTQWSKFVQRMARAKEGTMTKGARFGMFLFGVRRLADLGLITNVKRKTVNGQTIWAGTWVPPYSQAIFLSESKLQYQAFIKSVQELAAKFIAARSKSPGIFKVEGKPLTMSGFLALAHIAGFMGAINSLKAGKLRTDTLAFVKRLNGIF